MSPNATEKHAELLDHGWSVDLRGWWRSPDLADLGAYSLEEAWLVFLEVRDAPLEQRTNSSTT